MANRGEARCFVRCVVLIAVVGCLAACKNPRVVTIESREFFPVQVSTSLPTQEVVRSREALGQVLKAYGISSENAGLESIDFSDHAIIASVDASVAEVRRNPGVDIILLQPEGRRGLYLVVVRGDVNRLGKFTWK